MFCRDPCLFTGGQLTMRRLFVSLWYSMQEPRKGSGRHCKVGWTSRFGTNTSMPSFRVTSVYRDERLRVEKLVESVPVVRDEV